MSEVCKHHHAARVSYTTSLRCSLDRVRAASTIVWSILEIVIFFSCEAFPPSSPKGGTVDNHA